MGGYQSHKSPPPPSYKQTEPTPKREGRWVPDVKGSAVWILKALWRPRSAADGETGTLGPQWGLGLRRRTADAGLEKQTHRWLAGLSLRTQILFFLGLPLRTAPRDHQPPTTNRQPPTANRQPPPPTANRQPPTANRQPLIAGVQTRSGIHKTVARGPKLLGWQSLSIESGATPSEHIDEPLFRGAAESLRVPLGTTVPQSEGVAPLGPCEAN